MSSLTAACIQVNAGPQIGPNIESIRDLVWRARDAGADFILTPENVLSIEPDTKVKIAAARAEHEHEGLAAFRSLAAETGAWLVAGSLTVKLQECDGQAPLANRSYLLAPTGDVVATYDKIHMFDVTLAGGESYRESATMRPGARATLAETPWGMVGLTICYDLRFGHLYRDLAKAGAVMLTVPSAFTVPTGSAHWHVLLRARAIETGCFVLAPAQTGTHAAGRRTYGHSLIVAPWGEILADAGEDVGFVTASFDLAAVAEARCMVPSLLHDRDYLGPADHQGAEDAVLPRLRAVAR